METGETVVRRRSARPTVAGTAASRAELPAWLTDVAEVSSVQASAGGTARTALGGKAQRRLSRCAEAGENGSMWLSSAVAQDEASPLEHGTCSQGGAKRRGSGSGCGLWRGGGRAAVGRRGRQGSGGEGGWQVGQLEGWGPAIEREEEGREEERPTGGTRWV
jgi:hypothetical protein